MSFSKFHTLSSAFAFALHCPRQRTVTRSDKSLAKIAADTFPRRHAENNRVKVKDTHLMNNKLPLAEILCGECKESCVVVTWAYQPFVKSVAAIRCWNPCLLDLHHPYITPSHAARHMLIQTSLTVAVGDHTSTHLGTINIQRAAGDTYIKTKKSSISMKLSPI